MSLLLLLACAAGPPAQPAAVATDPPTIAARFGDWPFLTPVDAPDTVALRAGGTIATDAATCGACHPAIYADWKQTTHASALHDLQYLAELTKPGSPRWLCLNCHVPTPAQRATVITPATTLARPDDVRAVNAPVNPTYDPARAAEGVTCAACHVRRDADGAGIVVGPDAAEASPHRVRADATALRSVCLNCHSPGPAKITPTLFCWFETADELARGDAGDQTCVDCHMPAVEGAVATGEPTRTLRAHRWVGGGVPKAYEAFDGLLARGWTPGVDVDVALDGAPASAAAPSGGAVHPTVTLRNRAGHAVPTADPERFLRVEARLEDAAGTVVGRDVTRIGQRWDWGDAATGRPAHRVADERLAPGETRTWTPRLPAATADEVLVVEVIEVRLTPANAAGMRDATLDDELRGYWAGAAALLPDLDRSYPLAAWVSRERITLRDGTRARATPAELVAASAALRDLPLDEKATLLAVP